MTLTDDQLTEQQRQQVLDMFHPGRLGYECYTYKVTSAGWVLSKRKRIRTSDFSRRDTIKKGSSYA